MLFFYPVLFSIAVTTSNWLHSGQPNLEIMTAKDDSNQAPGEETTELSKQYETPMGLAHTTMQALKDRIKLHYDLASDYYLSLW